MEYLLLACVIVASLITTLVRVVSIKILFGYAVWVDLFFSLTITAAFLGTFSGVVAATLAGLILGVALSIGKATVGYQKVKYVGWRRGLPRFQIVTYPGKVSTWLSVLTARVQRLQGRIDRMQADMQERTAQKDAKYHDLP